MLTLDDIGKKLDLIFGLLANANGILIKNMPVVDTGREVQKPPISIRNGLSIVIKAADTNAGIITIYSKRNGQDSWPLLPGLSVTFKLINLDDLRIFGDTVGDLVLFLVEDK